MTETTMAPAERPMPVGYRFHPTDQELVGHYLRHKLKADDLSIHDTIPEIGVCKYEPWDLLDWATLASATKFDESQCFFFSARDYKYSNSNRSNRATLRGFWKVTGRDSKITSKDTKEIIGIKKILVYYEGRFSSGIKTNWVIHEYHDAQLSHNQRKYVLCWLRKDNRKKAQEKTYKLGSDERTTINPTMSESEYENQEPHFSNRNSINQIYFQPNEVIDLMSFESNEVIDSMIQISSQLNETINSTKQICRQPYKTTFVMPGTPLEQNKALTPTIHTPLCEPNFATGRDPIIQSPFLPVKSLNPTIHTSLYEPNSTIEGDSIIQTHFEPEKSLASIIDIPCKPNSTVPGNSIIRIPPDEVLPSSNHTLPHESNSTIAKDSMTQTSMKPTIHSDEILLPPEPNSFGQTSRDGGEFGTSSDFGEVELASLLQSPRIDVQGLFYMMATTSDMRQQEA